MLDNVLWNVDEGKDEVFLNKSHQFDLCKPIITQFNCFQRFWRFVNHCNISTSIRCDDCATIIARGVSFAAPEVWKPHPLMAPNPVVFHYECSFSNEASNRIGQLERLNEIRRMRGSCVVCQHVTSQCVR